MTRFFKPSGFFQHFRRHFSVQWQLHCCLGGVSCKQHPGVFLPFSTIEAAGRGSFLRGGAGLTEKFHAMQWKNGVATLGVCCFQRFPTVSDADFPRVFFDMTGTEQWQNESMRHIAVLLLIMLFALHAALMKPHVRSGLARLREVCQWKKLTAFQSHDQKLRFEKELLSVRLQILGVFHEFVLQLTFVVSCCALWNVTSQPSEAAATSLAQALSALGGYAVHALIQCGILEIKTSTHFRCLQAFALIIHGASLLVFFHAEESKTYFGFGELLRVITVLVPGVFMDMLMTFPMIVSGGLMFSFKKFKSDGVEVTATHICTVLFLHLLTASVVAWMNYAIQCSILDKIESNDDRSLLLGFRKVLKGVCDGNLVLDSHNLTVVDDSRSLEQLLKSDKKLVDSKFLDLFLDTDSRQRFVQFLNAQSSNCLPGNLEGGNTEPTMPLGFRVRLQGAQGPVSVDVFCTRLPDYGAGRDHYLLALKEDPEQSEQFGSPSQEMNGMNEINEMNEINSRFLRASDAEKAEEMDENSQPAMSLGRASSISEMLEACEELMQVSMLVCNSSPSFDIEEATLSFARSKPSANDSDRCNDFGMPTLRKFIRFNDWERVEKMFQKVCQMEGRKKHYTLRSPLLLGFFLDKFWWTQKHPPWN